MMTSKRQLASDTSSDVSNFAQAAATEAGGIDSATVAIVVAVIALVGVIAAQIVNVISESRRRRDEQAKLVREQVQAVMMIFYDYSEFARTVTPGKPYQHRCDPYEEQWDRVSGPLAAGLAHMAGHGKHRDVALTLVDGIGLQHIGFREGENVGDDPRAGYIQMAWHGFETVAAWLRHDRVPRQARRLARQAAKMRATLDAEFRWRDRQESGSSRKSGVIRSAARTSKFWLRRHWRDWIKEPAKKLWAFLFAE
ncbi:hypothetical protein [Microbacterium sp. LBN7]|uniref:hypothetical protein n=1 Tax=Microbacterium sp. LBN7 TaxID=3129773 RepID=UPI0032497332